jgi:hypothetical protein
VSGRSACCSSLAHRDIQLILYPTRPIQKSNPKMTVHNPKWRASHPLEDCLTAAWVGHGRWLLLDLSAQRRDYGPALGGEGLVVEK